jgi:hypothetical protein
VPNFFSQLWTGKEYRLHRAKGDGRPLRHAASNRFSDHGIRSGDKLYVWSFVQGRLLLLGRMEVDAIVSNEEAVRRLRVSDFPSNFSDHAIARSCTDKQFGHEVPVNIIRQLAFISPDGEVSAPKFRSKDEPDPQTFRGVRQITPDSANLLDGVDDCG